MKRGNPTVTELRKLPDVQDVSTHGNVLKTCLDRSFDLIKEHCMYDNVLKKFILICTDGTSTNLGCNNSLFTRI